MKKVARLLLKERKNNLPVNVTEIKNSLTKSRKNPKK
jgi:hypothetical protein